MKRRTVTIYEDPLTETKPEGQATLKQRIRTDAELEYWLVLFDGDPSVRARWVRADRVHAGAL